MAAPTLICTAFWRVVTDARSEKAASIVANRVLKALDLSGTTVEVAPYPKTDGHVFSFRMSVESPTWAEAVFSMLGQMERLGHQWVRMGAIERSLEMTSDRSTISGVGWMSCVLERPAPSPEETKRGLVERALASAMRVRPQLDLDHALVPPVVVASDACLAAVRAWLEQGDRVAAAAVVAAKAGHEAVQNAAFVDSETPGCKDSRFERAMWAALAAIAAAEAAAWTVAAAATSWEDDPTEARARAAAGPVLEAYEAERLAKLAER